MLPEEAEAELRAEVLMIYCALISATNDDTAPNFIKLMECAVAAHGVFDTGVDAIKY